MNNSLSTLASIAQQQDRRHRSPSPPDGDKSKKLRSIAACNRCKRRKQKCDNAFPKCTNCSKANAECVSKEQAYPASYVHALEQHVHQLEQTLKQQQQQLPPMTSQLPPINFVKTSTSSADQPASRDLIAMTYPNPPTPSYYLGSTSGFPLTKLVQAAIFGRALPKSLPIKTDPFKLAHPPAPIDTFEQLPPIEPLRMEPHQTPATSEAQLSQAFLSSLPPAHVAQRLIEAYFNGVHMRYPFIYKKHILDWNARREEIAKELAHITAQSPAEASAVLAAMTQDRKSSASTPEVFSRSTPSSPASTSASTAASASTTPFSGISSNSGPEYDREIKSLWFKMHMIYAIGARYLQLTGTYAYIPPDTHYHLAMRYLDMLTDSPLIDLIERLLLVVVFQLRSPSGPGIWHLTGFTVRLCVEAGFHRKLSIKSTLEDQRRKRIFWSLYVLERSVSVTLGRPFCISDRDIDVELPANVDEDIRDEAELERAIASSNMSCLTSTTSAILIMQIKRIASRIQEKIYRVDKQEIPSDKKFQSLRKELDDWGQQIINCKAFTPLSATPTPRLFMSEEYYMLNYHANMRLLFVPKLPMLLSDTEEFKLCLRSSGQVCQIYKRLHQYLRTVSYSFLALQASYMAGITMIYCYTKDQSVLDTQFLADIRACSTVLYIIAERWPASKHFRDSFEAFLNSAIESGEFVSDKTVVQAKRDTSNYPLQEPEERFDMNLSSIVQEPQANFDRRRPVLDDSVQDELWDILQQGAQDPVQDATPVIQDASKWPPLGNTVGNVVSAPADFPAREGWQNIQDMNSEMGVGLGNSALFRWPGDFGDLYY